MEKITFKCETITPMFLGGADGKSVELRPPSIKAAMRFWWRALNANKSISDLREEEAKIFGGSGEGEGRSKFSIRVTHNIHPKSDNFSGNIIAKNPDWYTDSKSLKKDIKANPIEYLGYGAYNFKDKWQDYFPSDSKFTVNITLHDNMLKTELEKVFKYLANFGGLGSKSRNGFGKFRIINAPYLTYSDLKSGDNSSSYSHLSKGCRVFKLKNEYNKWEEVLAKLGEIYRFAKLETDGVKHQYENRKFIAAPVRQDVFLRKTKPYFFNLWKINSEPSPKPIYNGFILYMPFFQLIQNRDIYISGFKNDYSTKLENACDKLNQKILLFSDLIEEVQL